MQSLLLITLVSVAPAVAEDARDTVVVCPESFLEALQPWLAHRFRQGHRVAYISNDHSAIEIRALIREVAGEGKLRHILLIGDAVPSDERDPAVRPWAVPTHRARATVNVRYGSEPEIATDNWYADLNDDLVPDVAIGRLTADDPAELSTIVRKILVYEQQAAGGLWRRRVSFVAGVGGFGSLIDSAIETTARKFITDCVPAAFRTTMTYGSWRSPYCPDPRLFRLTTLRRINEGCLLWIYMGHGERQYLDRLRVPGATLPILDRSDVPRMQAEQGAPIAVFMSCYTGAFDQPEDCLAEDMLRQEGAPVAIVSGSRVTMPYGMAVMGSALADEFFVHRRPTLGEVVLHAKRSMIDDSAATPGRRLLDGVAKWLSPSPIDLAAERAEHVLMYNLLGDPLLRLRYPQEVTIEVADRVDAGDRLRIVGTSEVDGECLVEFVCRRDRLTFRPPARREFDRSHAGLTALNAVYRKANDGRWASKLCHVYGGHFQTEIRVPIEARGPCHVRVFVQGENGHAVGAADVSVSRPNRSRARPNVAARRKSVR